MEMRTNAGYNIIASIHIGDYEFVLGESQNPNARCKYVTWECSNNNYYYGNYLKDDLFAAQKNLIARAERAIRLTEHYRGIQQGNETKDRDTER